MDDYPFIQESKTYAEKNHDYEGLAMLEQHGIYAYRALLLIRKTTAHLPIYKKNLEVAERNFSNGCASESTVRLAKIQYNQGLKSIEHAKQELEFAKTVWARITTT